MFGLFKGVQYRAECSQIVMEITGLEKQVCIEYVEDHKALFDGIQKEGEEPSNAVLEVAALVLLSIGADVRQ